MASFIQHNIGLITALPTLAAIALAVRVTWLECRDAFFETCRDMNRLHKESGA